jgi:hypothetical protein
MMSECLLLWECQAGLAALRNSTKFRWLFQSFGYAYTSALLAVPVQEMTIPAWAMN